MARTRSDSPKPWPQYEARTTFLRVPATDWLAVKIGAKTEFRQPSGNITQLWNVKPPTPVVGWSMSGERKNHDAILLVLEETWREPLGAISAESLAREGHPTVAHFRRYWMARTKRRFSPLSEVHVYRVKLFTPDDAPAMGVRLLERLYGLHFPD